MKHIPLFLISILLLSACGSIKPNAPSLPLSQINTTPLPDSKIDVPISVDLSSVLNSFSAQIPATFSGNGSAGPGQYRWSVQRQPFNLSITGNALDVLDTAHFTVGGYLKNPLNGQFIKVSSCDAGVTIGINATFTLQNNYSLAATTQLSSFDLQACQLNLANINITPIIRPAVINAINNALVNANQQLKNYNLHALMQPVWASLNQPIKIADLGYVNINPTAVRVGNINGTGKNLNLSAGITARPVFYLGAPEKSTVTNLPDITGGANGSGFSLNMDVHLAYPPLNDALKKAIANQDIPLGDNAIINLSDAEIYGTGNNHLLIKVVFSAKKGAVPFHGLLYFTCLPGYDVNTGNFYVSAIDFDVSTIQKLKEGPAGWILTSALKKRLGEEIHFNIGSQVNALRDKMNRSINGRVNQHVVLSGKVTDLSLQGILPLNDYILVRVKTSGSLSMQVD
jgi:hypothetical protein